MNENIKKLKLAICVISYNRPNSTYRVLESISKAYYDYSRVDLIISIDNSGKTDVLETAQNFKWEFGGKRLVTHEKRLGLKNHVIEVGNYTNEYDGLIVLEDDIIVSPSFFLFARECVAKYYNDDRIAGISLYSFNRNYHNRLPFIPLKSGSDIYLMQNAQSWGQVWMPRQWKNFIEWYNLNNADFQYEPHLPRSICSWKNSWLKYHTRYCIEHNKWFIYPYSSLSTCFSDVGEHSGVRTNITQVPFIIDNKSKYILEEKVIYDAFFENIKIPVLLGLNNEDVCIDLYGERMNKQFKRYWITHKICDYKIIHSFGLQLKPMEANIIYNTPGNELFVYDTSYRCKNPNKISSNNFLLYINNLLPNIRDLIKITYNIIKRRISQ